MEDVLGGSRATFSILDITLRFAIPLVLAWIAGTFPMQAVLPWSKVSGLNSVRNNATKLHFDTE